jgi:lipopolysaccharide biosynthesis protein
MNDTIDAAYEQIYLQRIGEINAQAEKAIADLKIQNQMLQHSFALAHAENERLVARVAELGGGTNRVPTADGSE